MRLLARSHRELEPAARQPAKSEVLLVMRFRLLAVVILALTVAAVAAWPASAHKKPRPALVHKIDHLRAATNKLRIAAGLEPIRTPPEYRNVKDRLARTIALDLWRIRFRAARNLLPRRGSVWSKLAECESNGDWDYNGSSGYDGGLQFLPQTWNSNKPRGFPRYAWQATPKQQIKVAKLLQRRAGWGQWPACSSRLGLR